MIKLFLRKWREKKVHSLRQELGFIEAQIGVILAENDILRQINTKVTRESAGQADETRSVRLAARSGDLRNNCGLLGRLNAQKHEVMRRLERYASV